MDKKNKENKDKKLQKELLEQEKRKDRILNNVLLVTVLILLIYILFVTGAIKLSPANNKTTQEKDDVVETEEKEKLTLTDTIVTSLYKQTDLGRSYNALRHYYFYSYDSLPVKYMDDAFIKEMALSKLTITDQTSIDANILEDKYKSIVGNNILYKNKTFQTQCQTLKYDSSLNSYNIVKNQTCDTTNPDNAEYFDKIVSAYKFSDRIEINTRVGYSLEEKELVSEGVYQDTGKTIIKKDIDTNENIGIFTESLEQIKKTIDYSKLTKYKYTFRLDNAKYYFYSVEKIEE